MDVKESRTVTITLNENDIIELKEQLLEINELWDASEEEMREYYFSGIIGKIWRVL